MSLTWPVDGVLFTSFNCVLVLLKKKKKKNCVLVLVFNSQKKQKSTIVFCTLVK